jgi:MFS family permease
MILPISIFSEEDYDFPASQAPTVPGAPARPLQLAWRRWLYAAVGILLGIAGGLGNALVSANLPYLLGSLGAEANEAAWIPTAYSMTYIGMNLMAVRFRQQFGLRLFAMLALSAFCIVVLLHVLVQGFAGAIVVHAFAGVATAPMTTMSVYYLTAAWNPKTSYRAVIVGLGLSQIATPLARMMSGQLMAAEQWRTLYLFELGLGLVCLGAVALLRLPPSQRSPAFEPLDFATYPLIASGLALLCAVLGLGRNEWWTDCPWLGWALAAAIPLLGAGFYIELNRARPLLDLRWLTGPAMIRFAVVVFITRIVIAEQSTSVVGLFSALGVANDELGFFSLLMVCASIAGIVASAVLFTPDRLTELAALAIGFVAIGAYLDSRATSLTTPEQLYVSQGLIAFATTMFIGPALLFGLVFVLHERARTLPTYLTFFVILQNLGSLAGSALLGTFQVLREKAVSVVLFAQLSPTRPAVLDQLAQISHSLGGDVTDPAARSAIAIAQLHRQAAIQANVLAFDNTFVLVAVLALATCLYLAAALFVRWRQHLPLNSAAAMIREMKKT